ncbi:MAG: lysophospholipase [Candidatus Omnitrophica bacterium]|nr:lysophospholipase [Candidatus Omnitrophota bacterium]
MSGQPVPPREEALNSPGGWKLLLRHWEFSRPKAECLLVHGLGEHSGRYQTLASDLTGRGFEVWAIDHRGHGRSEGRRGDCRSMEEFLEDLEVLVQRVKTEAPRIPRVMVGHSLGGLIALIYAARHPNQISAVAVSSPALGLSSPPPPPKAALVRGIGRILPTTPIPNGIDPKQLCRDPSVVRAYEGDPLINRTLTARCALVLERAIQESIRFASEIRIPCLILQAGSDAICSPEATRLFARRIPEGLGTFHLYEGMYHELFNEPERAQVVEELVQWLNKVLP